MTGVDAVSASGLEAPPPTLTWRIEEATSQHLAVTPTLRFRLAIGCAGHGSGGGEVQSILLAASVRVAATQREYDAATQARLVGVFGQPHQWGASLRDLVWDQLTVVVPPFTGSTTVELPVRCGSDVDLAAVSYLQALRDGEVALRFVFSGTIFYRDSAGRLRAAQIPWEAEAAFEFPAEVWHRLRGRYFGDHRWLRLRSNHYERLRDYRARSAFSSWEDTIDSLLPAPTATSSDDTLCHPTPKER